jgi:hypothetical protein
MNSSSMSETQYDLSPVIDKAGLKCEPELVAALKTEIESLLRPEAVIRVFIRLKKKKTKVRKERKSPEPSVGNVTSNGNTEKPKE